MCKTQIPSTQSPGASVSPSSSATTNSSSLYNDVCSLSANASSEDLTAPNSRIPPPVAHNTSSLDPFNANTGSSLGEANPISAPPADGDEVWYCCSCTTGPYLVALYPACTACHHSRCYYCKIDG